MSKIRLTYATAMVVQALDRGYRYGFDIAEVTGIRGGTVYPILRRLEENGFVEGKWEDIELARSEGRPSRRYYALADAAAEFLASAETRFGFPVHAALDGREATS